MTFSSQDYIRFYTIRPKRKAISCQFFYLFSDPFSATIGIFRLPVYSDHAVNETDNKGAADEDNKIRGKKCHQKRERIVKFVGRNEQPDAKIYEKGAD